MKTLVLTGLIAASLAGVVGFAVGRRSADRPRDARPAAPPAPAPSTPGPAIPNALAPAPPAPAASTENPERAPAAPKTETPVPERVPARRRLIELLSSNLADDKLFYAVRNAAMSDPALQKKIFEELMSTQDAEMLNLAKDCFYGIKDPGLMQQILDAFAAESWPERKAALAHVIGSNLDSESARTVLESILAGSDPMLLESALARTSVQGTERHGEFATRLTSRLRDLVTNGGTSAVRAAAARSLRGDRSQDGIAFLVDRMLNDPDPEVQMQAMIALPITYSSGGFDVATQVRPLLAIVFDEKRPEKMRRWAADRALMGSFQQKDLITDEQREILKKLAERSSKGKYN